MVKRKRIMSININYCQLAFVDIVPRNANLLYIYIYRLYFNFIIVSFVVTNEKILMSCSFNGVIINATNQLSP